MNDINRLAVGGAGIISGDQARLLVHKQADDQALLHEVHTWRNSLFATLRVPPPRLRNESGRPLFIAEALRQSTILAGHALLDVPLGWAFLMDRMVVQSDPMAFSSQSQLSLTLEAVDMKRRNGYPLSLVSRVSVYADDLRVGEGSGYLRVLPPRIYARLRADQATSANMPSPGLDNGFSLEAVAPTARGEQRWRLKFDPADAFFFDHPVDHLPGMVMFAASLEASRRLAAINTHTRITGSAHSGWGEALGRGVTG